MDPAPATPGNPAATADASTDAEAWRLAELQGALVAERAATLARAREVEQGVLLLRQAVQDLQAERNRLREENVRIADQLEQSRRLVATLTEAQGGTGLAGALDQARADAAALAHRLRMLEVSLAGREAEITRQADRIAELEATLASAGTQHSDGPDDAPSADPYAVAGDAATAGTADDPSAAPADDAGDGPHLPGLRVERVVAETADEIVVEARETGSRRPVTVRILPGALDRIDSRSLDSALVARHPNLVSLLAFAVSRQGPYLVLERETGETASAWVARIGSLPEHVAVAIALEAARGLRQAAFHGAHHGDLSPDSVRIEVSGRVRVSGAGLRDVLCRGKDPAGAPAYAAPERLRDGALADARSDLWSLGAVLFFLLTGRPPFEGDRAAVAAAHAAGDAPDVRSVKPDVSAETAALVATLLSRDPERRPPTWDRALIELQRRVPSADAAPESPDDAAGTVRRALARKPWIVAAALAAALASFALWRVASSDDVSAVDRWREAAATAERLAAAGDAEGARAVLRPFLAGAAGDDVADEAAKRYDALR